MVLSIIVTIIIIIIITVHITAKIIAAFSIVGYFLLTCHYAGEVIAHI